MKVRDILNEINFEKYEPKIVFDILVTQYNNQENGKLRILYIFILKNSDSGIMYYWAMKKVKYSSNF